MTKSQRQKYKHIKNLVTEGKEGEANEYKMATAMGERLFSDALDAGRRLRKEAENG